MGYNTFFSIDMCGPEDKVEAARKDAETYPNDDIQMLFKYSGFDTKWYHFEEEFSEFAKRHPDVLFCVQGDGEETWDLWEFRIKGKVSEYHQAEMPAFTTRELLFPVEIDALNNN